MLISIVVPVFNEESTVGNIIERLKTTMQEKGFVYEIIVVDDYSKDRSVEISKSQEVKVYSLRKHMGKGYALRVGFAQAKGEIIVTIDSDGSHRPEELPCLLNPILKDKADFVIGSRFLLEREMSTKKINRLGVHLFNVLIRLLTGKRTSDSQSGYRAIKSASLRSLNFKSNEYEIESEMLVKAADKCLRIKEVPVSFEQRTFGKSMLDPLRDGIKILLSIMLAHVRR
jgi:glycosyltransferase involved in cell wall biosynthesis